MSKGLGSRGWWSRVAPVCIALLIVVNVLDGIQSLHGALGTLYLGDGAGTSNTNDKHTAGRFAVAHYAEGPDQIYGIYSIHRQMAKHRMLHGPYFNDTLEASDAGQTAAHIVVVPDDIRPEYRRVLASLIGEANVRPVEQQMIHGLMRDEQNLWKGVMSKTWLFNLTDFDKVIMLDADVLIRTNIMHWFDYETPCGIQAKDDISWNSGAMVIRPDGRAFQRMLEQLPYVQRYDKNGHKTDPLTSGFGQQAWMTAFFLNNTQQGKERCVMSTESAVLVSSLPNKLFDYYNKYRPWVYQTVHFTTVKPWRNHKSNHPFVCKLLREWNESMSGIEEYYGDLPPISADYLSKCPPVEA